MNILVRWKSQFRFIGNRDSVKKEIILFPNPYNEAITPYGVNSLQGGHENIKKSFSLCAKFELLILS